VLICLVGCRPKTNRPSLLTLTAAAQPYHPQFTPLPRRMQNPPPILSLLRRFFAVCFPLLRTPTASPCPTQRRLFLPPHNFRPAQPVFLSSLSTGTQLRPAPHPQIKRLSLLSFSVFCFFMFLIFLHRRHPFNEPGHFYIF
jgi:hypothetical protein